MEESDKEFSRGAFAPQLGFVDTEVSAGHFHPLTTLHIFGVYLELVEKIVVHPL